MDTNKLDYTIFGKEQTKRLNNLFKLITAPEELQEKADLEAQYLIDQRNEQ